MEILSRREVLLEPYTCLSENDPRLWVLRYLKNQGWPIRISQFWGDPQYKTISLATNKSEGVKQIMESLRSWPPYAVLVSAYEGDWQQVEQYLRDKSWKKKAFTLTVARISQTPGPKAEAIGENLDYFLKIVKLVEERQEDICTWTRNRCLYSILDDNLIQKLESSPKNVALKAQFKNFTNQLVGWYLVNTT